MMQQLFYYEEITGGSKFILEFSNNEKAGYWEFFFLHLAKWTDPSNFLFMLSVFLFYYVWFLLSPDHSFMIS